MNLMRFHGVGLSLIFSLRMLLYLWACLFVTTYGFNSHEYLISK